ncbi:unnamed protein product [Adineta steineri]|uniref:Peptidyl-prolyl cis-trans isomerase n=1 Tax=Adineta steineri TaxID=433720 RepID=A0A818INA1_9BILA|nr:unnamed protein product [Adineta steineri]
MSVVLETTLGDITIDLYYEERPTACKNFLYLCLQKYYNFCLFHSIQINFIAQTGDPTGTGRGGESVFRELYGDQANYFDMEKKPLIKHRKRGTISMVNNTNNQHGSQFYITLVPNLDSLDGIHTVFGEVVDGWDVLDKINIAVVDHEFRPYHDIRIIHTVVLSNPFDIPSVLRIPERSPSPTIERVKSSRIAFDELFDEDRIQGKTDEEIKDYIEEKEAQARAQILELIGDLPEADMKPPENVLFVCKLNQVTTDEDLETIFSRFGEIISCEIVRDKKTGDSLCYAFIEYDNNEDAEQAYFKMDNVLIDDRRIHVDFSQSVAKEKWKYDQKQRKLKAQKAQPQRPPSPSAKPPKVEEKRRQNHNDDRHDRDRYRDDRGRDHRGRDHRDHDRERDRKYDRNRDSDRDRGHDRGRDRKYDRSRDNNRGHDHRHRRDRSRS